MSRDRIVTKDKNGKHLYPSFSLKKQDYLLLKWLQAELGGTQTSALKLAIDMFYERTRGPREATQKLDISQS